MKRFFHGILFGVLLLAQVCLGSEILQMVQPILKDKPRPQGKVLQRGEQMQWKLQPFQKGSGKHYLLSFLARYELPLRIAGQYGLQIEVNGKTVTPDYGHTRSGIRRLVNRKSDTFHGTSFPYFENGAWNVASNPELQELEIVHAPMDGMEIWHYQLEVTDLLTGEGDCIVFRNCGTQAMLAQPDNTPIPLRVSGINLSVALLSELPEKLLRSFTPLFTAPTFRLESDGGARTMEFPAYPKKEGKTAVLRIQMRLDIGRGNGCSRALELKVNGKLLTPRTPNQSLRILNRLQDSFAGHKLQAIAKNGTLAVLHSPSYDLVVPQPDTPLSEQVQCTWAYIEVDDMLNMDKPNFITFTNLEKNSVWKNLKNVSEGKPELEVAICELGEVDTSLCSEAVSRNTPVRRKNNGPSWKNENNALTIHPAGGFQLENADGELFFIESFFSVPGGAFNRWNCAGAETKSPPDWQSSVKTTENVFEITGTCNLYQVRRRIVCTTERVDVFDTIVNSTNQTIGLIAGSQCISAETPERNWVIGSPEDVSSTYGKHENPGANSTIFLQMKQSGLGITINDDVFRLQCDYASRGQLSRISTSHLAVNPGEAYTLEWSLYPKKSNDYYDFINTVRNAWDVNHRTLLGTFAQQRRVNEKLPLESKLTPEYRTFLDNLGVGLLIPFWYDYRFSPHTLSRYQRELDWYHKNAPHIKVLLPIQSVFMRRTKADQESDFGDSIMTDSKGNIPKYNVAKDGSYSPYRYFTMQNSFYAHVRKTVEEALDMGFDGIYFDTPFCIQSGYARFTYDRWDGRTVDLDPTTFEITRKYADLALLSREAWMDITRYIVERNKTILFNNPPIFRELNTLRGSIHFMTEGDQPYRFARLHLSTPTMLGVHWLWRSPFTPSYGRRKTWQSAEDFADDMHWKLSNGVLYYSYNPPLTQFEQRDAFFPPLVLEHEWPTKYMFPATVTDIHAGWVRAHERIITCVKGSFAFPEQCDTAELRIFDKHGKPMPTQTLKPDANGEYQITPPEHGIAILIRKD